MAPSPTKPTVRRLEELDVLRGLAALAVLMCHYVSACVHAGVLGGPFRFGAYGAHLFFLISGFVIFMTLAKTERPLDFVVSRLSRLYPTYWVAVAFTAAMLVVLGRPETRPGLSQTVLNLTMFQTWFHVPNLDCAYWTLGLELKFYVLMLVLYRLRRLDRIEWIGAFWLVAIAADRFAVIRLGLPNFTVLRASLMFDYAQLFIAGIVFYRLKSMGPRRDRTALLACCLAAQFAAAGLESACIMAGFFGVFHLFIAGRLTWIARGPLVLLGTISYGFYLMHGVIGDMMIPRLATLTASPAVLIAIPTVVSLVVAWVVTRFIERPVLKRIRDGYQRLRPPVFGDAAARVSERCPIGPT